MTRANLFALSGLLAIGGLLCLWLGTTLLGGDIRSHVAETYPQYRTNVDGSTTYVCNSTRPDAVATVTDYLEPEAEATENDTTYLRYEDDIVVVGPDGANPCTVRVEDLGARYSSGGFIFLGPGFSPGSPAGGSGGSPGGPGDAK